MTEFWSIGDMGWSSFTFSFWIPTAICGLVIAIWIDSIKFIGRIRFFTHIFKEVLELFPTLTDNNPTGSIVFERDVRWVFTSSSHICPSEIGRAWLNFLFCISPLPMTSGYKTENGFLKTPATKDFPVSQMIPANHFKSSAIALAKPMCMQFSRCLFDYSEISKNPAG